jgi:para-nitrobenzyl esterase
VRRPVIVWIHGGAFVGGSSALYRLDQLARSGDVVVVSLNYRLGVFGFMPHPAFDADHNGGYALEDQRLALRWVRRNIAAFGGDPDVVRPDVETAGCAVQAAKGRLVGWHRARRRCSARIWFGVR